MYSYIIAFYRLTCLDFVFKSMYDIEDNNSLKFSHNENVGFWDNWIDKMSSSIVQ